MSEPRENLKKLVEIYGGRLKILKEFSSLSDKITEETDSIRDAGNINEEAFDKVIDAVDEISKKREELLDKIKEADTSARYCESLVSENVKKILKEIKSTVKTGPGLSDDSEFPFKQNWARYLFKNLTEYKTITDNIKAADEKNAETVTAVMEILKGKIKAVKENKKMMGKFEDGYNAPSVGTLLNKKN